MRPKTRLANLATHAVLLVAGLFAAFPLFWVGLTSLKNNRDATASARNAFNFEATLQNYTTLFQTPSFLSAAVTSLVITALATLIVVVIATLGGYAFARVKFHGRKTLASVMVVVQIIPGIVLVIPLFRIVSGMGMYDQWLPLILILSGLSIPFATWLMLAFFKSSPLEIEEAALVDGVSRVQLFQYVLIPMVAPGMATAAILRCCSAPMVWEAIFILATIWLPKS